ncbi:hypothetical protein H6G20_14820 [Desertifilum sp. FACHB-1129]|uniref:DUF6335 family protein n=2 Tax=Desertifilum tharense IPPAS B-1220 TaxID=1781255 RepID=A0ACD5GN48_9CYAN|nr:MULTISPECIES: DUF6335 family protein [unclassified Desertifilum]MBD2312942.1 hypothetical protein [Desertifilum sp. FACHB-1129]MBD2323819.1 hypothetical protein [Desertifilum sp. FACHB-866]MBD2333664.1 hypothetical protein [Desertifilum sp. FACHB-868]MDA0210646.1 DUF6335 family protein [Cyanobacteria bacterium FC1]
MMADETYRQGISDRNTGMAENMSQFDADLSAADATPAGELDNNRYQAAVVGEESPGGTTPTPDQDVVEEIAATVGVEMDDRQPLRINDTLERRDRNRSELDPATAEDYEQRRD